MNSNTANMDSKTALFQVARWVMEKSSIGMCPTFIFSLIFIYLLRNTHPQIILQTVCQGGMKGKLDPH